MAVVMVTYGDYKKQRVEVDNLDVFLPDHFYWQLSEQESCYQQSISANRNSKDKVTTWDA
jgi:hypothetical protein